MSQIRLKLDKFVGGTEQRIFKTTSVKLQNNTNTDTTEIKAIEYNTENIKVTQKDVFYGEYSTSKLNDVKLNNNNILSGNLINFHDINCDYIINRPDKHKVLSFNRKC